MNIQSIISLFTLPSSAAPWYWRRRSPVNMFFMLVASGMYLMHPFAQQSITYHLAWLIPVVLLLAPSTNIFANAFGATFGSTMVGFATMLYLFPLIGIPFASVAWWNFMFVAFIVQSCITVLWTLHKHRQSPQRVTTVPLVDFFSKLFYK